MNTTAKITQVASTVAELMGIDPPRNAQNANETIINNAKSILQDGAVFDRVLIYNPDAIALWLYEKYADLLSSMIENTDLKIPMKSVMPSVTPVCFASMYTGVIPEIHGIRKYEKPVLKIDTLFDELIKAGKKCAIVSDTNASMSKIFLEREMDYFIFDTIEEINQKAVELIKEDQYDFIAVYNANYDSTMHKYGPESEEALDVLKKNSEDFTVLVNTARLAWKSHNVFYGFCPDHGCHEIDGNCGSHGLDMDEDMNVIHAYGWQKASCKN